MRNTGAILGTCLVGALGWFIAYKSGAWSVPKDDQGVPQAMGAQVLGYLSAVLYLGARIPQIYQNYRKQSCEGKILSFNKVIKEKFEWLIRGDNRTFNVVFHVIAIGELYLWRRGMSYFLVEPLDELSG